MRLPNSVSAWTIAVFGVLAVLSGLVGLAWPEAIYTTTGFGSITAPPSGPDSTRVFSAGASVAALNMGVYYLVAAATGWRPFFWATVPFRLLTCALFTTLAIDGTAPGAFVGVGLWEGCGAVATGVALWHETRRAASARRGGRRPLPEGA